MKRILILTLTLSLLVVSTLSTQAAFDDTGNDAYAPAINYLQEKGVVQGYTDVDFKPEQTITRAEFVKILLANYGFEPEGRVTRTAHPYKDVVSDAWYAPYIQKAWEVGVLDNAPYLEPNEGITRVEGTELMLNLLGIPVPRLIQEEEWPLAYRDVRWDSWFAPAVLYGEQYGLIMPLDAENGYFRPLKPLSRGEAAQFMVNMDAFLYGQNVLSEYTEVEAEVFGDDLSEEITVDIPHLDIFVDIWNRIHDEFYTEEEINDEQLIYEALKGLVEGLEDPYSVFLDPPLADNFNSYLDEGKISGIGAQLSSTIDGVIIQSFIIGGPAETSGLQVNDRIVGIDGEDVTALDIYEIANLIRGEEGTDVGITVRRKDVEDALTYTITRAIVEVGYIKGEIMGDAIYIDINQFTGLGFIDFTQTVLGLIEEKPDFKGFVIDVRNNPGGYLDTVLSVLGHFIPKNNTLVYLEYEDGDSTMYVSGGKGEWSDYPVVVLIDEGSASAAEIFAIVMKEKYGSVLVGTTSYGKGTVQAVIDYVDGSTLKLTLAEWRSPKMHSIHEIGITPHEYVEMTDEDILNGRDPQLEKALEVLSEEILEWEAEQEASATAE